MPSFRDLTSDSYYLLLIDEGSEVTLVSVILQTRHALLLRSYMPHNKDFFRLKDEAIYKLIEELDEAKAREFEALYREEEKLEEELFEFEKEDDE
jgi:hypothetical protein